MRISGRRWVVAATALTCVLLLPSAVAEEPVAELGESSIPEILQSIQELESARDAKCYATASRLEDFIYGTPLSDEARFRKIDLQKDRIRDLWQRASVAARDREQTLLTLEDVQPFLDRALTVEPGPDGAVRILLGGSHVLLQARDLEHYSSVAYALRALLAVQQDQFLAGGEDLLPADPEAIEAMRHFLDLHTLAALSLADGVARLQDEPTISAERLEHSWSRVVSAGEGLPAPAPAPSPPSVPETSSLAVFRAIIEAKLASYAEYNRLQDDPRRLFWANMTHFYLRYPLPDTVEGVEKLERRVQDRLDAFVADLLAGSEKRARKAGHPLIRVVDVADTLQAMTPHRMNAFEDATFFPRLPRAEQITVEAYDMDSFRDLGLHWRAILRALDRPDLSLTREPDPFAAELVAEGAAQYGVLLLRVAGAEARAREIPFAGPEQLDHAVTEVERLAAANAAAPEPAAAPGRLVSAAGASAGSAGEPGEGLFFDDITPATGLRFEHRSSDWLNRLRRDVVVSPPTFSGGGIAAEDVNGDGLADLLLLGGGGNGLFLADGQGGFRDVTRSAGIDVLDHEGHPAEARQPLIADFDNDGNQDLLITYVNENHRVYRGLGNGKFEDASSRAGLGGLGLIGGPATTFDFDGDGLLDVYLCYFGDYLNGHLPNVARHNDNGIPNRLFRNRGGMRFEEVAAGPAVADSGWCQAVSHTDFDLDGRQDIIVANDYGRNAFLRNLGNGRFENVAAELGVDEPAHSMNVGIADLNWDNHPDLYISNIVAMVKDDRYVLPSEDTEQHFDPRAMARMRVVESNVLHVSRFRDGELTYVQSGAVTRGANSTGWAWDADFFDFDNDGDDDLYCVNGTNDYFIFAETRYLYRDGEVESFPYTYSRESNVFFVNRGNGLENESGRSGADFVGTSRSTAYLDFDDDGDLDIAVNNFHSPAVFLRNNAESRENHWLKVRLVGDPGRGSNRDAIGARMLLRTAEGGRVWREVHGGTGYLSMDPREQHFGLGASEKGDLWIRWPDGEEEILRDLPADSSHVFVQGESRENVRRGR